MSRSDSFHKSKCFVDARFSVMKRSRVCSGWASRTSSLVILNFLFLLSCLAALVSRSSSGASDLQTALKAFWECSPLPQRAFFFSPPPKSHLPHCSAFSLLLLQDFRPYLLIILLCRKPFSSSSAVFPLFLTLLFLPMCRVFPGVAAAVLAGRCCTAAPLLGAAAAWGAWGLEGASTGGATSKRTRWSCTRKSLPHLPHPPAPHLWSPVLRSTPAPPTSRRPGADKKCFRKQPSLESQEELDI